MVPDDKAKEFREDPQRLVGTRWGSLWSPLLVFDKLKTKTYRIGPTTSKRTENFCAQPPKFLSRFLSWDASLRGMFSI